MTVAAVVIERSATAVLTLDEIYRQRRRHRGIAEEDDHLQFLERVAVRACEGRIGGPLLTARCREVLREFPRVPWLHLDLARAQPPTSITVNGQPWSGWTSQPADRGRLLRIEPAGERWPTVTPGAGAVVIEYDAGFGPSPADVPEDIRAWLLYRVGTMDEYREEFITGATVVELPTKFVDGLLKPYKPNQVHL
ncbi:head-tail connector protein [Chitinimonas lacunae]|uniref:Head-tail connector protein n=1 Tax=Chitinimonas lacunae TaxID=1963018 RepID=A0ABV8MY67_9NEIS